jgi:hypothetical protein
MSFGTSALLLAWIAIVLLAFGLAGLLRQVSLLTRGRLGNGAPIGPGSGLAPRTTRDLVGFRLPATGGLADLPVAGAHRTVVVFVSPGCPSCTQTLEGLAVLPEVTAGSVAVVAVSTGSCEPARAAMGDVPGRSALCISRGRSLLEALHVPATPYLMALDEEGTIVVAALPSEDTDLGSWVRHTRGSMTLTEETP